MEQAPSTAKSIESFMKEFVMKKNDVPPISGKPTLTKVNSLLDVVDQNLINMNDDRDTIYGKLHLVTNTSQLVGRRHNKLCRQLVKEDCQRTLHQQQHVNDIIASPGTTKINNTGWMTKMYKKQARSSSSQSSMRSTWNHYANQDLSKKEKPFTNSWIFSLINFKQHQKNKQQ